MTISDGSSGFAGVMLAMPVSEFIVAVCAVIYTKKVNAEKNLSAE